MEIRKEDRDSLVTSPRETLDVEIKQWIDPSTPEGIAKIAKACMALRNNNGGCLLIGLTNTGPPDRGNAPPDARTVFTQDRIQGIVGTYASLTFEIEVAFVEHDGVHYPLICVPAGVETPIAAKAELKDQKGKSLISSHAVYVRSLHSNNSVSTTAARYKDYERLTKICFENREADIGAFVRRHLSGMNLESFGTLIKAIKPEPTPIDQAKNFLNAGKGHFLAEVQKRRATVPDYGLSESAVVIDGDVPPHLPDESLLNRLQVAKSNHTGWSPWIDLRGAREETWHPYVTSQGWQALVSIPEDHDVGAHLDFWRIEPAGRFYNLTALLDDLPRAGTIRPTPKTELDFYMRISHAAEVIDAALSFARSLGCSETATTIAIAFRWTGLSGRYLTSWVDTSRSFRSRGASQDSEVTTAVSVPLEAAESAIAGFVEKAVSPLFVSFGGIRFESSVIAAIVNEVLKRRF